MKGIRKSGIVAPPEVEPSTHDLGRGDSAMRQLRRRPVVVAEDFPVVATCSASE